MTELMGAEPLVDWGELGKVAARIALDLASTTVVVQMVYFRLHRRREHVFTCYVFNVVTLCLCLLLRNGPAGLGFGMTLFGVFGILRFRTEQIRSRDLTYLFIVIGMGILNGATAEVGLAALVAVNGVIAATTALLELALYGGPEASTPMSYDRLELLQPGQEASLAADIETRTGLAVVRVEVQRIDLLHDAAEIMIYFRPQPATREQRAAGARVLRAG